VCRNVDMLVDKIASGLEEVAKKVVHGKSGVEIPDKQEGNRSDAEESEGESDQSVDIVSPVCAQTEDHQSGPHGVAGDWDLRTGDTSPILEFQDSLTTRKSFGESRRDAGNQSPHMRANSCPPSASRPVISGPWSLEWLHDQNHEEAGVIFSARKGEKEGERLGACQKKVRQPDPKRRKAGGLLRHPIHSLKKVARLPRDDRVEVLKVLNKSVLRRRRGVNRSCMESRQANSEESSSSDPVNNDWKNWVAMQGSDQMVIDDVRGFGHSLGVEFKGDNVNMFSVLSRAAKSRKDSSGRQQKGVPKEKGC
ncbi:hypothetical protein TSUD_421430, partial [Trifolium subterraneum]